MTILIVAILNGRTKEEWYSWIKERVNSSYGYATPDSLPTLYSASRLLSFRARRDAREAQERARQANDDDRHNMLGSPLARVLAPNSGLSFAPSSASNDSSTLMFTGDDSDDEESGDDETGEEQTTDRSSFFSEMLGLGHSESPKTPDLTKHLKDQLDEYEKDIHHPSPKDPGDASAHQQLQGEAPPPPKPLPNGDASGAVEQLKSEPHGDEPLPVVQAEGLMDTSEDPLLKT